MREGSGELADIRAKARQPGRVVNSTKNVLLYGMDGLFSAVGENSHKSSRDSVRQLLEWRTAIEIQTTRSLGRTYGNHYGPCYMPSTQAVAAATNAFPLRHHNLTRIDPGPGRGRARSLYPFSPPPSSLSSLLPTPIRRRRRRQREQNGVITIRVPSVVSPAS